MKPSITLLFSLAFIAAGCVPLESSFLQKSSPPKPLLTTLDEANFIRMDVAQLIIPADKNESLKQVWILADENPVPLEMKQALNANGIRIGTFTQRAPDELLQLLISKKYCPNPRRMHAQIGKEVCIPGWNQENPSSISIVEKGYGRKLEMAPHQFAFFITPEQKQDGRLFFNCIPGCSIGEAKVSPKAVQSSAGNFEWDLLEDKKAGKIFGLAWTLDLQNGDFILIGAGDFQKGVDSLGNCMFRSGPGQMERLIVIRCSQKPPGMSKNLEQFDKQIPLAVQAAWNDVEKSLQSGN